MAERIVLKDVNIISAIERDRGESKGQTWIRYSVRIDDPDWHDIEFRCFHRPALKGSVEPQEGGPLTIYYTEEEYQGTPQYVIRQIEDPRAGQAKPKPKPKPKTNGSPAAGPARPNGSASPAAPPAPGYGRFQAMIDLIRSRNNYLASLEDPVSPEEAAVDCVIFARTVIEELKKPSGSGQSKECPGAPEGYSGPPKDDNIPF